MLHIAKFTIAVCPSIGSVTIAMNTMEWALTTCDGIEVESVRCSDYSRHDDLQIQMGPGNAGAVGWLEAELEGPLQESLLTRLNDLTDHCPCSGRVQLDIAMGAIDSVVHCVSFRLA